jgi:DNA modification methylase
MSDVPFAVPTWPPVEIWALDKIKPYDKNPRTHPDSQIKLLADLMKKYGVDQPIVVDETGTILKGHGRRLAAIAAGFMEFPVAVHRGLSDADKSAIRIADNQSALLSGWDEELLRQEIVDLRMAHYDLDTLGFPPAELSGYLLDKELRADPDALPEPVQKPIVRQGDLWLLGEHRLLCGDGTLKASWDKLLNPVERAAMVFTDPPYGVSYQNDAIVGDNKRRDDLYKMLVAALKQMAARCSNEAAFYIWHASVTRNDFSQAMTAVGLIERQYLIWVKPSIVLGHADYMWQHEPCFYASKSEGKPAFYGARNDSTVWRVQLSAQKNAATTIGNGILLLDGKGATLYVQSRVPKNKKLRQLRIADGGGAYLSGSDRQDSTVWEVARDSGNIHPTQKPVELARRAIENSSRPGEIIADAFLGSATTLIGAELTGRHCVGCECDPVYAQLGIERWQNLTGKTATCEGKTLVQRRSISISKGRRRRT